MCNVGVVADELSVEIGESEERADILYLGWGRPVADSIEFSGVHFNVSWGYYHSQVVNVGYTKLTFFLGVS